jgi:hypothetical protein
MLFYPGQENWHIAAYTILPLKATHKADTHLERNSSHSFVGNPQRFNPVASMVYFAKI